MVVNVVGDVDAMTLKFKWGINNFCTGCKNVGDFLESPKFPSSNDCNDIHWYMRLYPKGQCEDYKDYLALYLFAEPKIKAVANFKIFDSKGKAMTNETTDEKLFNNETGYGFNNLISRDLVMNPVNGILNDDKITIVCEITIVAHELMEVKEEEYTTDLSRFEVLDNYEDLIDDSKFSDVSLISEGKTLKVHKCILAKNSSVFAVMFDAEMKEKQENTIEIADINYDVLQEMIRFIYTGKVNNIDILVGELAIAADKYSLDILKNMCEKTMTKNLSVDNVIDCLQLADKLRMDKLEEEAIDFIVKKASDTTKKPEFKLLSFDIVCKVCRSFSEKK